MRATLHDELMREAGFETDHDRELDRRRERRRRSVVRAAIPLAWLVLMVVVVVQLVAIRSREIPESLAIAAVILGLTLHGAIRLMKRRASRWKGGH